MFKYTIVTYISMLFKQLKCPLHYIFYFLKTLSVFGENFQTTKPYKLLSQVEN